jgi:hypothetical protein
MCPISWSGIFSHSAKTFDFYSSNVLAKFKKMESQGSLFHFAEKSKCPGAGTARIKAGQATGSDEVSTFTSYMHVASKANEIRNAHRGK